MHPALLATRHSCLGACLVNLLPASGESASPARTCPPICHSLCCILHSTMIGLACLDAKPLIRATDLLAITELAGLAGLGVPPGILLDPGGRTDADLAVGPSSRAAAAAATGFCRFCRQPGRHSRMEQCPVVQFMFALEVPKPGVCLGCGVGCGGSSALWCSSCLPWRWRSQVVCVRGGAGGVGGGVTSSLVGCLGLAESGALGSVGS